MQHMSAEELRYQDHSSGLRLLDVAAVFSCSAAFPQASKPAAPAAAAAVQLTPGPPAAATAAVASAVAAAATAAGAAASAVAALSALTGTAAVGEMPETSSACMSAAAHGMHGSTWHAVCLHVHVCGPCELRGSGQSESHSSQSKGPLQQRLQFLDVRMSPLEAVHETLDCGVWPAGADFCCRHSGSYAHGCCLQVQCPPQE
jgi:hypothetical protein